MVQTHGVAYGVPAAKLLRDLVAEAKADDPLAPVTIVVPTDSVGTSARRSLAAGRHGAVGPGNGIAGLYLLTVRRLGELLGAPRLAAMGRRPATTPVLAAAVRGVLADEPGMFAPVAEHPATDEALVRMHRELADCADDALDALAATGDRAADVVRIHRAVRDRLVSGWYEERDLLEAARQVTEAGSPVLTDLGTVIIHLPQDLSLAGASLLRAVADHRPTAVVAGLTGVSDADAPVLRSIDRLGAELTDPDTSDPTPTTPPHGSSIISVSDADEEARSAVDEILAAARRDVPLERIGVLYPSRAPYARILHEHLEAASIPYNGAAVRPLAERVLGRWILELLHLRELDFDRAAVFRLLTSAPMRWADGERLPTRSWERISREAGVVGGRDGWEERLARYAADARGHAELAAGQEETPSWLVERFRRNADHADQLRSFVCELIDDVERAATLTTWRDLSTWARATIHRYLGDESARGGWPEPERLAADRVEAAVEALAGLDQVEAATSLEVLRRTLDLEFEQDLGRTGLLGQGVLVGPPSAALGVDLDVVIVLGMAEGVFPARPHEDPLINDEERQVVADRLPPRRTRIADQHRQFLSALASASIDRILVYPRGDLRQAAHRSPSRWLLDTMEALTGDRTAPAPRHGEVSLVPSFASRTRAAGFPATQQAHGLRALDGHLHNGHELADHPLVSGDLRHGVQLLRGRRHRGPSRFDGFVGAAASLLPSPLDPAKRISASALEQYLRCPHAYLMRYVLRIEAVENPEELLQISAADRGSLVHEILETWLREQLADPPAPHEPWSEVAGDRLLEIAGTICDTYDVRGVTGHRLFWERDRTRILTELQTFLERDRIRRSNDGATPAAVELPFGLGGAPPVEVVLPDSGSIRLRGKIDRIDRTSAGALLVTDYKTGSFRGFTDLDADRPLGDGTKLQLPLYALAARAMLGEPEAHTIVSYWFTSTKGEFKDIRYHVTSEVLDELTGALRVVLDGIADGHFPLRPEPPGWRLWVGCAYCDPDELGTTERFRRWEVVQQDPRLRRYLRLVEPAIAEVLDRRGSDGGAPPHGDTERGEVEP